MGRLLPPPSWTTSSFTNSFELAGGIFPVTNQERDMRFLRNYIC